MFHGEKFNSLLFIFLLPCGHKVSPEMYLSRFKTMCAPKILFFSQPIFFYLTQSSRKKVGGDSFFYHGAYHVWASVNNTHLFLKCIHFYGSHLSFYEHTRGPWRINLIYHILLHIFFFFYFVLFNKKSPKDLPATTIISDPRQRQGYQWLHIFENGRWNHAARMCSCKRLCAYLNKLILAEK